MRRVRVGCIRATTPQDGIISWEEFKDAMTRWLGGSRKREIDDAPGSPSVRCRRTCYRVTWRESCGHMGHVFAGVCVAMHRFCCTSQARKRIHRDISSFFTQFRRRDNFDEIRAKIRVRMSAQGRVRAAATLASTGLRWCWCVVGGVHTGCGAAQAELDDESGDLYSADPIERQRQKEVDADTKVCAVRGSHTQCVVRTCEGLAAGMRPTVCRAGAT